MTTPGQDPISDVSGKAGTAALLARALAGVPDDVIQILLDAAELVVVPPGATVIVEGEPADALHLVTDGTIQLSIHQRQRDLAVASVGAGELLGWSWLVPPHRWDFDAGSMGGATILRIPAAVLQSVIEDRPDAAAALATTMVSVVSRRLRDTRVQLLDLYARADVSGYP